MLTLYEFASEKMNESISLYFNAVEKTKYFTKFTPEGLQDKNLRNLVLAGKTIDPADIPDAESAVRELNRVSAIPFDVEAGASYSVYDITRGYISKLMQEARVLSSGYTHIASQDIKDHPYLLPIWQAALNVTSKAGLKKQFGSASDQHISLPSAKKIANYANEYFTAHIPTDAQIQERTERTLEGIVRDLVGRLLFEAIVKDALDKEGIPYVPESDCTGLQGVVYTHRPDFVIPNEREPLAFIEVRKSSSRHASLYAKDKMFSAINWKGKHKKMLAIIVAEGEWTHESLTTMSMIFDYVVPASRSRELAKRIADYMNGDDAILKWIINFSIEKNQ